ncbi:MAG: hypothetical protein HC881_10280, partial [Leptolyngbyaceae cyanobacterium SL_7_1]|nr:hypothetical protein [Leptolyngbyaceae cyanobacterium SL_7_1]
RWWRRWLPTIGAPGGGGAGGAGGTGGLFAGSGATGNRGQNATDVVSGDGQPGGQGGGGAGLGGAIFVTGTSSQVSLVNSVIRDNATLGGNGANGGQGKGAGIFIHQGTVNAVGTTFSGNTAVNQAGTATDNNNVFGTIGTLTLPNVTIAPTTNPTEGGTGSFTVTLDRTFPGPLSVRYTLNPASTATSGTDFPALTGTVIVPAGSLTATISVPTTNDAIYEIGETITLNLVDGSSYNLGATTQATITIADNEPIASLSPATLSTTEGGTASAVTINLTSPAPAGGLTVDFALGGNGIRNTDYTLSARDANNNPINLTFSGATGTVVIPQGTSSASISVSAINDGLIDPAETVSFTLNSKAPNAGNLYGVNAAANTATVTIVDAQTRPAISIAPRSATIAENGTGGFDLILSEAVPVNETLTIAYTVSGTATSGSDFSPLTGTVVIPGGTPANQRIGISLPLIDDLIDENNETVQVTLSTPSPTANYVLGATTAATVTILDNDTAGVSIQPASGTVTELGGQSVFSVVLNSRPTANAVVNLSSSDTSEGTVSTPALTFTSADWNVPQTVTVTGVDDAVADGNQSFSILTAITSSDPSTAPLIQQILP